MLNLLDVALVCLDHLADVSYVLLELLDLGVVLLDTVEKALTGFWEGQIHLVSLQLEVLLVAEQLGLLLLEVLRALFECVLLKFALGLHEPVVDLLELAATLVDL